MYSLSGFGIPANQLPADGDRSSNDPMNNHFKWCAMRQAKDILMDESEAESTTIVECPHHEDYLFGKVCNNKESQTVRVKSLQVPKSWYLCLSTQT